MTTWQSYFALSNSSMRSLIAVFAFSVTCLPSVKTDLMTYSLEFSYSSQMDSFACPMSLFHLFLQKRFYQYRLHFLEIKLIIFAISTSLLPNPVLSFLFQSLFQVHCPSQFNFRIPASASSLTFSSFTSLLVLSRVRSSALCTYSTRIQFRFKVTLSMFPFGALLRLVSNFFFFSCI